ncbi:unnamed protein product [Spirodela intermedia]|uniref:Uncharacterized protein n=1 Tax=Spirodela intermedia TaxID=51605 RepID=A0A7I8ITK0_SPIIN|nr:unnamed protein product [Spirodela intermedia]CAA6661293.1 unnamed protein product [Spirodela intermedia]
MGEGKGSSLVYLLVVVLSLVAFGFAIAAERRRSTGRIEIDPTNGNYTFCVYDSDVATGYGVGAFLFLSRVRVCSWPSPSACASAAPWPLGQPLTFLIAEACLVAGAKNAYHTKYRGMVYAQSWTCESLRKGCSLQARCSSSSP